jgi:hypothetical protein
LEKLSPLELPHSTKAIWKKTAQELYSVWQLHNCNKTANGKHMNHIFISLCSLIITTSVVLLALN